VGEGVIWEEKTGSTVISGYVYPRSQVGGDTVVKIPDGVNVEKGGP